MDWYSKQTKDLLVEVGTNAASGFATQYQNAGTVKNTGLELSMGWRDQIGKEFKYGVNVNMAYNKNEVTEVNNANHLLKAVMICWLKVRVGLSVWKKDILLAILWL